MSYIVEYPVFFITKNYHVGIFYFMFNCYVRGFLDFDHHIFPFICTNSPLLSLNIRPCSKMVYMYCIFLDAIMCRITSMIEKEAVVKRVVSLVLKQRQGSYF